MQDLLLIALLAPFAFLAALATGMASAWLMQLGWRKPHLLLPLTVFPLLCLFALTSLTLLGGATNMDGIGDGRHWSVAWSSRLVSLILVGAALERIFARLRDDWRLSPGRLLLLLGFGGYWCSNVLSPMLFGAHRLVSHEYLYPLVLGCAALLAEPPDGTTMIRCCRDGLFTFMGLGLLILPVMPHLVMSQIGPSLLPFVETRFSSLASHPNQLGPLTVVFLLCAWHTPWRRRWMNWLGWMLGIATLLLSGSKTTLLAFLLVAAIVALARYGRFLPRLWRDARYTRVLTAVVIALIILVLAFWAALLAIDPDRIEAWLRGKEGAATVTVTGRDLIWRAAIEEWHRHPVFGYGLSLWDAAFRAKVPAYHAHNQVLQSLAVAGLVGGIGLVAWVLILGVACLRSARASRGLSVGLFVMLVVRGMTEVPLAMGGYGMELLTQLLLMMTVASCLLEPRRSAMQTVQVPSLRLAA